MQLYSGKDPTEGADSVTSRHTLTFDGTQCPTCPMNCNTHGPVDNVQVYVVFKFSDISGTGPRDAMFRNDNGVYDKFVALSDNKTLIVGGTNRNSNYVNVGNFPIRCKSCTDN